MKPSKQNTVHVFETIDALNHAAAELIIDIAAKSIKERGRFTFCLSGGNTPKSLYTLLSTKPYSDKIEWKDTFVFWSDERFVPYNDERNNAHMANITLLQNAKVPASNIFPMPVALKPEEAAKQYEETLHHFFGKEEPRFDVMLLGLGDNGHTASLFPGTAVLHETSAWVKDVFVKEVNMYRLTMTAPLINKARHILFLVTGKEKSQMLDTILSAPFDPDKYPAQLIKPDSGELLWFADKEAAVQYLKKSEGGA